MSATATETSTIPLPSGDSKPSGSAPELTIINRVVAIPLVSSFLDTLHENAYTHSTYESVKGLSSSAYKYTEPIQTRIAPLLVRADGFANKAVDVVEARFPSAFTTRPEEISGYVREKRKSYEGYARERRESVNKAIDERVRTPAFAVAEGIDQRFAPIVSFFEARLTPEGKPQTSTEAKYQYQRALALYSQVFEQTNAQLREIQAHSVLLQRATGTAHALNEAASSSVASAQAHVHALSSALLSELQKIQSSAAALATRLQTTASSAIPHQAQEIYEDFSKRASAAVSELRSTLAQDIPLQEKAGQVGKQVQESIQPLLENGKKKIEELLARGRGAATATTDTAVSQVNGINGGAH